MYFLKTALNAIRRERGLAELDAMDFLQLAKEKMRLVDMEESLMNRAVNEGFSGGERSATKCSRWQCWNPGWRSSMRPTRA